MRENIPMYSDELGYGFISTTSTMPPRKVNVNMIQHIGSEFLITEAKLEKFQLVDESNNLLRREECTTYDFGGMVYRVRVNPGAYKIEVITTAGKEYTSISVSGMDPTKIINAGVWDAAGLISIKHYAKWNGDTWTYEYVSGTQYIDIEIEPLYPNVQVGIKDIKVTPVVEKIERCKPTIFLLGDSTVKSYVFEEAPMNSWGQVVGNLFDKDKVNVINYSNGGRSLKFMYIEGRFNDLLLNGKPGDFVFLQSGHNDEREGKSIGTADGETARFGRGATEEMFHKFLANIFIPAIRSRGMIPVLITPVTRMNICETEEGYTIRNSFTKRKFPEVIKKVGKELNVLVLDLNTRSVEYMNEIGIEGTKAIVMSIEPGETPGKTNSGSYANGNPDNKIDGTHYKEALSKQYSRMIIEELYKSKNRGNKIADKIISFTSDNVKHALETQNWDEVYPEICKDAIRGKGSYYRNQIEKLVQLGVMLKNENGNFEPFDSISIKEYISGIKVIWQISDEVFYGYSDGILSREVMGAIIYDAYKARFGLDEKNKPKYMTDYNGTAMSPEDPDFDPNLPMNASQYYPTVAFSNLMDLNNISIELKNKLEEVYKLGLIRSEKDIKRGSTKNGIFLEPKTVVSRGKAAKSLYYLWILINEIKEENHKAYIM